MHSLEAAQLGRSIARNLQLNEDLIEAIVLAHGLGCAPLKHAGQNTNQYQTSGARPQQQWL